MSFYFFLQILCLMNIIEIYVGKESTECRFKDMSMSMVCWFICLFKLLFISGFVGFNFSFLRFLILLYEVLCVRNDNYNLFFHYQYQQDLLGQVSGTAVQDFYSYLGYNSETRFPVKIRNKIKVKFRVRNEGQIQG